MDILEFYSCISDKSHLTLWFPYLEDAWVRDAWLARQGYVKRKSVISADSPRRYVLIKLIVPSVMQQMTVTAPCNGAGLLPSFIKCAVFLKCSHFPLFLKHAHTHMHNLYFTNTLMWIQLHGLFFILWCCRKIIFCFKQMRKLKLKIICPLAKGHKLLHQEPDSSPVSFLMYHTVWSRLRVSWKAKTKIL